MPRELQFTREDEFVLLKELLLEDTEEIKGIKSLFQRETEYLSFLGPIESFFAYFYLDNPKIRDSDIKRAMRNIKLNFYKDIAFFKDYLERELIGVISETLKQNKKRGKQITRHELFLVLNYILWAIDNREHLGDPRAYLKWICNFFNMLPRDEKEKFDKFYEDYGRKMNLSGKKISILKNEAETNEELPAEEILLNKLDSEKFGERDDSEFQLWEGGEFIESFNPDELQDRLKTFDKGHNEDMNFNCKKCSAKISAHNKDWHDGICDKCFNEVHFSKK